MPSSDSFFKDVFRSFFKTFVKVIAFVIALFVIVVGLSTLSSGGGRYTTTEMLPNHNWKIHSFSTETPTIVQIPIQGTIGLNRVTTKEQLQHVICDLIELDLKPGMLKAILLNINSPGGTAEDSDAMMRMLMEFKQKMKIPVYAYVDGLCASGGLMVSLAADKVIASSPSLIGSVGVILSPAFNFSQTMEKVGIQAVTIHAGKGKDELDPFRPWTPDEAAPIQAITNGLYDRFLSLVTTHRPRLTEEDLRDMGAKVVLAKEALDLGFIDEINDSYPNALEQMASSLDIVNNYQIIELKPTISLSELFSSDTSVIMRGVMHHHLRVPGDIDPELQNKVLYLYTGSKK